jgi:ATP phosphoribosyltransferase
MPSHLTIALSKGRILKEVLPLFATVGIEPTGDIYGSRKLVFETSQPDVRLLVIRATDVPTYVAYGVADMGVAGKDVLMEHGGAGLYEPLDLQVSKCRLMTCAPVGAKPAGHRLRVASKFVHLTKQYYSQQGQQVDIIKLHGAMELAPILGLADQIVDIVDTGDTLRANGLEPLEKIADISSRLVVGEVSMKLKHARINTIVELLIKAVMSRQEA